MHIDVVPNRKARPTYLLHESVREGKRIRKRTIANLSALPIEQIETIRRALKGEKLGPVDGRFECTQTKHHGHSLPRRRPGVRGSNGRGKRSVMTRSGH